MNFGGGNICQIHKFISTAFITNKRDKYNFINYLIMVSCLLSASMSKFLVELEVEVELEPGTL